MQVSGSLYGALLGSLLVYPIADFLGTPFFNFFTILGAYIYKFLLTNNFDLCMKEGGGNSSLVLYYMCLVVC